MLRAFVCRFPVLLRPSVRELDREQNLPPQRSAEYPSGARVKGADVQKFVLLKPLLGNMPEQVIEGIPVSEEEYRAAVDVLTRRYARDDVRRDRYVAETAS